MTADQNFYDIRFTFFYPTASATAYGQRPKFVRAEHSATAEGENCAYGPTLLNRDSFLNRAFLNRDSTVLLIFFSNNTALSRQ